MCCTLLVFLFQLVSEFKINKTLLPPKKLFGNQSEEFVKRRRKELEIYLQTVIRHFVNVPNQLAVFLDFQKYVSKWWNYEVGLKLYKACSQCLDQMLICLGNSWYHTDFSGRPLQQRFDSVWIPTTTTAPTPYVLFKGCTQSLDRKLDLLYCWAWYIKAVLCIFMALTCRRWNFGGWGSFSHNSSSSLFCLLSLKTCRTNLW